MKIIIDISFDGTYWIAKSDQLPRGIGCDPVRITAIQDFLRVGLGQVTYGLKCGLPDHEIVKGLQMDLREEKFVDDSGLYPFNWRAHNAEGHPIVSVPEDSMLCFKGEPVWPDQLVIDGLVYGNPQRRQYGDYLYMADKPGPIIPGQPFHSQPKFRHEKAD